MKAKKILFGLALCAVTSMVFTSCDPQVDEIKDVTIGTGVYVLNSGKFQKNNASITYYDFTTGFASGDIFLDKNQRGLGDTGEDGLKYGSKLYITVYNSNILEVVNAKTGMSIKSIAITKPRSITAANGKVYVVQYTGQVTQLDTTTLELGTSVTVGANPDASVISNNKLFVANTGGMAAEYDSTISVIDLVQFKELKKIKVNLNPGDIQADNSGDVYVISNGNYGLRTPYVAPKFQRIEAGTDKVTDINLIAKGFDIAGDKAYLYTFDYDSNWQATNKKIAVYDVKNEKLINENIVNTDIIKTPYCIDVDPLTSDIYLGVTDYVNNGKMYCLKNDGTLKLSFMTGVNPCKTIFVYNK